VPDEKEQGDLFDQTEADPEVVEVDPQFAVGEYNIEIVDDEPLAAEPAETDDDTEVTDEELKTASKGVQKRIDKLTWRANEERRKAEAALQMQEEAIRFAKQTQAENQNMRKLMDEGSNVLMAEIRSRTTSDVNIASQQYTAALNEGDPELIAKAQMALNKAQIEQSQAEQLQGPQFNAVQQPGAVQQPQAAPQRQEPQHQGQRDPAYQGWLRDNPWFEQNQQMRERATAIHTDIVNKSASTGTIVGSVAYYNEIDSEMRKEFPTFFGVQGDLEPAGNPAPPVVAPAARATPGGNSGGQQRTVQLTRSQRRVADAMGIPLEVYVREHLKLNAGGE
jgi:hypothetical protein